MNESNDPSFVNMNELKVVEVTELRVNEYHPLPHGQGEPTEVHLMIRLASTDPRLRLAVRLKSRRIIDELIGALTTHRDSVWPVE